MEETTYSVISRGTVLEGFDRDMVKQALSARLGLGAETVEEIEME